MGDFKAKLKAVSTDSPEKASTQFAGLITEAFKTNTDNLVLIIEHLSSLDAIVVGRSGIAEVIKLMKTLNDEKFEQMCGNVFPVLQPKAVRFASQVMELRNEFAARLQAQERFTEAARVLAQIPLDTAPVETQVDINVRIAQLYLEDDETHEAQRFILKAGGQIHLVTDPMVNLRFKSCFARVQDGQRKFVEASLKYYELSSQVNENERGEVLRRAMVCAMLAPGGPQRTMRLAILYKDERASKTDIYPLMEKMYLERIIRKQETKLFFDGLQEHQMAVGSDGLKVHEKAIIEHNLLAASKIYLNIKVAELGILLDIPPEKAEAICSRMVAENRMAASIDQTNKVIRFHSSANPHVVWDGRIEALCSLTNDSAEILGQRFPQFVK